MVGQEAEECSQAEDSSYDGSEGRSEEGSEGGSEGVQPSKLLVDFGEAGDAWWQDFIAAKEQMLNDILQATP